MWYLGMSILSAALLLSREFHGPEGQLSKSNASCQTGLRLGPETNAIDGLSLKLNCVESYKSSASFRLRWH